LECPLCRSTGDGLSGVAERPSNRIARVLASVQQGKILILHGFIDKTLKTSRATTWLRPREGNREFER